VHRFVAAAVCLMLLQMQRAVDRWCPWAAA
jgi:hypothetical protein